MRTATLDLYINITHNTGTATLDSNKHHPQQEDCNAWFVQTSSTTWGLQHLICTQKWPTTWGLCCADSPISAVLHTHNKYGCRQRQSTGPQRETGSVVDRRQPGEELWKRKWRRWSTAGSPSRGWPVTDRGGRASLLPYMPAGMTGSHDVMMQTQTQLEAV